MHSTTEMFQAFDSEAVDPRADRQAWMALLARAPLDLLESALAPWSSAAPDWLRKPETGLYMVQGRAGATGERFNLGEVTVTRCALRLASGGARHVGVAYVLGRLHRKAHLAATADALLQDVAHREALDANLLQPLRQWSAQRSAQRQAQAQSTKVEFFTVARESGGADGDEDAQ
jgi:alpha-D-ribose 1-methylphosphonate 5-triphosphate synthase subunit PhnG